MKTEEKKRERREGGKYYQVKLCFLIAIGSQKNKLQLFQYVKSNNEKKIESNLKSEGGNHELNTIPFCRITHKKFI